MDRNGADDAEMPAIRKSLSARRAWIEIVWGGHRIQQNNVALRKESVDRNILSKSAMVLSLSRSPQGERG